MVSWGHDPQPGSHYSTLTFILQTHCDSLHESREEILVSHATRCIILSNLAVCNILKCNSKTKHIIKNTNNVLRLAKDLSSNISFKMMPSAMSSHILNAGYHGNITIIIIKSRNKGLWNIG